MTSKANAGSTKFQTGKHQIPSTKSQTNFKQQEEISKRKSRFDLSCFFLGACFGFGAWCLELPAPQGASSSKLTGQRPGNVRIRPRGRRSFLRDLHDLRRDELRRQPPAALHQRLADDLGDLVDLALLLAEAGLEVDQLPLNVVVLAQAGVVEMLTLLEPCKGW